VNYVEQQVALIGFNEALSYAEKVEQLKNLSDYLRTGDAIQVEFLPEDGDVVLIDFGGGYTNGWVDGINCNTVHGDLQGLENIISFMREKVVGVKV
jgi:hypothetical protein